MVDDPTYLAKLERFKTLYCDRIDTAVSLLAGDSGTVTALENSRAVVVAAIGELTELYREIYLARDPSVGKDTVLRFTRLEANIAMTVAQTLDAARALIGLRSASGPTRALRARAHRRAITMINASLARRDDAAPLSTTMGVKELLLARRKPVTTALRLVGLVGLHRPISDWSRWLDPGNFFRADDITFTGIEAARAEMADHPRRVMVLIGNHDSSLYDIPMANRIALMLGTGHHVIMTRKNVYPIPPPESAGDVVYVDEEDPNSYPVAESVARLTEFAAKHDVVSMAIFPEGMMPFTAAQMPLAAKDGAYVVARKAAIAFAGEGVPVYLVEFTSNTLEHLNAAEFVEPEVRVVSVEVVPAEPVVKGRPDEWILARRVQSQILYNGGRGERMMDVAGSGAHVGAVGEPVYSADPPV